MPPSRKPCPIFSVRAHLDLGWSGSDAVPGVVISEIYRKDAPDKIFTPSPTARDIWLQAGDYIVKIDGCNQRYTDFVKDIGTRLGPAHLFGFSVNGRKRYTLKCTTSPDGALYAFSNDIQIEPTD